MKTVAVALVLGASGSAGAVRLDLETLNGVVVPLELDAGTMASYGTSSRTFRGIRSALLANYPNVICFSTGTGNFNLELTDRNGYVRNLNGVDAMSYHPLSEVHTAVSPGLQCLEVQTSPLALDVTGSFDPLAVCAGGAQQGQPPLGEQLFASSFEEGEGGGGNPDPDGSTVDLRLNYNLLARPTPNDQDPMIYEIYAVNCGTDPANNVRIRDLVPVRNPANATNPDPALLDDAPVASCDRSDFVSCTAGTVSGTPYVLASGINLPAGEWARVTVERSADQLVSGDAGDTLRLSLGVIADGELPADLDDNVRHFVATLVTANNLGPDVVMTPGGQKLINEDPGGPITLVVPNGQTLIPVSFSLLDPEGNPITSVTIDEIDAIGGTPILGGMVDSVTLTFDADNDGVFGDSVPNPLPSGQGQFRITIEPTADFYGTGFLRISATDDTGATGVADFSFDVQSVNDAPAFNVASLPVTKTAEAVFAKADDIIPGGAACHASGNTFAEGSTCADLTFPLADANIALTIQDWLSSIHEGAANETVQTVTMEQRDPANFGQPPVDFVMEPAAIQVIDLSMENQDGSQRLVAGSIFRQNPEIQDLDGDGDFDLFMDFRGVVGEAYLRLAMKDDGPDDAATGNGDENRTELRIKIEVVDNLPPMVTVNNTPDAINEDSTNQVLGGASFSVAASDTEGTVTDVSVTVAAGSPVSATIDSVDFSNLNDIQIEVTPAGDAFGDLDLEIVATDNSSNMSAPVPLTVSVVGINDPPELVYDNAATIIGDNNVTAFDPGSHPGTPATITLNTSETGVIADVIGFIENSGDTVMGPGEGSQTLLSRNVVAVDPSGVFTLAPSINSSGTLQFVLSGTTGSATLSITLQDSGGVANGGDDTSDTYTLIVTVM